MTHEAIKRNYWVFGRFVYSKYQGTIIKNIYKLKAHAKATFLQNLYKIFNICV